jgi:hypothetical protein
MACQGDGTENRNENQNGCDFKREQELGKQNSAQIGNAGYAILQSRSTEALNP